MITSDLYKNKIVKKNISGSTIVKALRNQEIQQLNDTQHPTPEIGSESEQGNIYEEARSEESIDHHQYPSPRRDYQKRDRRPKPVFNYSRLGGPGYYVQQVQSPLYPQSMPVYYRKSSN